MTTVFEREKTALLVNKGLKINGKAVTTLSELILQRKVKIFTDLFRNGEAQAAAFRARRFMKAGKYFQLFKRFVGTCVFDRQALRCKHNIYVAAFIIMPDRIADQVT